MSDQAQEKKSTAKPIGGISQYATIGGAGKRSDAQPSERSDPSTSKISDIQNARLSEVQTSRLSEVKRKQHTVYLSPGMSKWIKLQAVQEEREISIIVEQALEDYRTKLTQPVEQKPQPRGEVEAQQPVPGDLVSLQEFADLHAVNRNEAARLCGQGAITAIRQGAGRHTVIMLAAKGRRDFWVQFHETPGFRACDDCPHK